MTSLEVEGVEVAAAGLVLTQRGTTGPLLTLEKIHLAGGRGDLISRELTVPEIFVSRGRVAATMARGGTVTWQTLVATSSVPAAPTIQLAFIWGVGPARGGAGHQPGPELRLLRPARGRPAQEAVKPRLIA